MEFLLSLTLLIKFSTKNIDFTVKLNRETKAKREDSYDTIWRSIYSTLKRIREFEIVR